MINLLILVSQTANVLMGGDPDEMLCSRAWRLRNSSDFWAEVVTFFDVYCWPLSEWKGSYASHCEACYFEELRRIEKRAKEYDQAK